jgi:hypothetical protein
MPTALRPDRRRRRCLSRRGTPRVRGELAARVARLGPGVVATLAAWHGRQLRRHLLRRLGDSIRRRHRRSCLVGVMGGECWGHGLTGWGGCTGEGSGQCGTVLRKRSGPVHWRSVLAVAQLLPDVGALVPPRQCREMKCSLKVEGT